MSISLLAAGRLAIDPDFRNRVAAAAAMRGHVFTEDLLYAVIQAPGVGEVAEVVPISDTHPRGVDSSPITDAAILAAVDAYQVPEETE